MKFLIIFVFALLANPLSSQSLPNIIYIYADDLGYGELGCYGQKIIKTPHLDRMAAEGIRFTRHYSSAPVCAPSRCMLLTGKHSGNSYIRGNYELGGFSDSLEGGQMPLPENTLTIAKVLKQKGYQTACIGKWGLGMHYTSGDPNKQGFDYFYGYLCQKQAHNFFPTHLWENGRWDSLDNHTINVHRKIDKGLVTAEDFNYYEGKDYAPDRMTSKASSFIQKNKKNPFFLYLSYPLPHLSLQIPSSYLPPYINKVKDVPYYSDHGYAMHQNPSTAYAAMITYLDQQVSIIMDQIKKAGLDEQTIILFSSDNGTTFLKQVDASQFNSTAGLRGFKMDLYEGGIRVPFIVRWPGKIKAGTESAHLSVQYDLMATLCELIKIKAPANDGISYLPTLLGKKESQKQRSFTYFEYPENGGQIAVHLGSWKGVKRQMKTNKNAQWELYNLIDDPSESRDLSANNKAILAQLDAIVKNEHRHAHIKEWEFINNKF